MQRDKIDIQRFSSFCAFILFISITLFICIYFPLALVGQLFCMISSLAKSRFRDGPSRDSQAWRPSRGAGQRDDDMHLSLEVHFVNVNKKP